MINLDLLLIKQKTSIQIHMRKIEKPELISTIRDKKKVWLNIRESRLCICFIVNSYLWKNMRQDLDID